jgi:hypothetical protein
MSAGTRYAVDDLRVAAWDALRVATCRICGAPAYRILDDVAVVIASGPGQTSYVEAVGHCRGEGRHRVVGTAAI